MIQDIAPHRYDNAYKSIKPKPEDYVVMCRDREVFVLKCGEEIAFPTFGELVSVCPDILEKGTYLFSMDERPFFLISEDAVWLQVAGNIDGHLFGWLQKKELRDAEPMYLAFAGITALQLFLWYESRKFCGKCGHPMVQDDKERMMRCVSCGQMEYPKICPAVIVAVTNGNQLLLSKYADRDFKKYALIAGFAEIGETIEETVWREVMEEVGLKVKNLQFYKSQPWSFTDTLLFGFFAELDGDDTITLDREELAEAEWFEREEIPVKPSRASLTNEMIMKFKEGR